MKKSTHAAKNEDHDLLDINELLTGGKDGITAYPVKEGISESGIFSGDIVAVDDSRKATPGEFIFTNKYSVRLCKETARPNGLHLAARNGLRLVPKNDADILGVIVGVVRKL